MINYWISVASHALNKRSVLLNDIFTNTMAFCQRHTIDITHRSQKCLWYMTLIFDLDLDLWMTFTCWHIWVDYKHIRWVKYYIYSYDLDLDPMTLILKLNQEKVKMILNRSTEHEVPSFSGLNVMARTDRQTNRPTWVKYFLPTHANGGNLHLFCCGWYVDQPVKTGGRIGSQLTNPISWAVLISISY